MFEIKKKNSSSPTNISSCCEEAAAVVWSWEISFHCHVTVEGCASGCIYRSHLFAAKSGIKRSKGCADIYVEHSLNSGKLVWRFTERRDYHQYLMIVSHDLRLHYWVLFTKHAGSLSCIHKKGIFRWTWISSEQRDEVSSSVASDVTWRHKASVSYCSMISISLSTQEFLLLLRPDSVSHGSLMVMCTAWHTSEVTVKFFYMRFGDQSLSNPGLFLSIIWYQAGTVSVWSGLLHIKLCIWWISVLWYTCFDIFLSPPPPPLEEGTRCSVTIPKGGQVVSKPSGAFPTVISLQQRAKKEKRKEKKNTVILGLSEINPFSAV